MTGIARKATSFVECPYHNTRNRINVMEYFKPSEKMRMMYY